MVFVLCAVRAVLLCYSVTKHRHTVLRAPRCAVFRHTLMFILFSISQVIG